MRKSLSQIMFSICLLAVGIVLLLVNIGVISLEIKHLFVVIYPFILFAYGCLSLIYILLKRKNNLFFTVFILTLSGLLILDRIQWIDFRFLDFWKLWPLIIIFMAFGLMRPKKFSIVMDLDDEKKIFQGKSQKAIMGDIKYNKDNWMVEPMSISTAIGNIFMDFSKAYIPERETVINIQCKMGDIKLLIPDDLPVSIYAIGKLGDLRIFESTKEGVSNQMEYESPDYDQSIKKIRLNIHLKLGSVSVQKV